MQTHFSLDRTTSLHNVHFLYQINSVSLGMSDNTNDWRGILVSQLEINNQQLPQKEFMILYREFWPMEQRPDERIMLKASYFIQASAMGRSALCLIALFRI